MQGALSILQFPLATCSSRGTELSFFRGTEWSLQGNYLGEPIGTAGPQRMTRTKREVYTRQPLLCSKIGALNLAGYEPKVAGVRPSGKGKAALRSPQPWP